MKNPYFICSVDPRTSFLATFPRLGYHRFESSYFPAMYLFIEDGILKAGTPNNGNDVFEFEKYGVALMPKQSDCYIAFNWDRRTKSLQ